MHCAWIRHEDLSRILTSKLSTPPPAKRPRTAQSEASSPPNNQEVQPLSQISIEPRPLNTAPPPLPPGSSSRKRPASPGIILDPRPPPVLSPSESSSAGPLAIGNLVHSEESSKKRSRTNTPWTAVEEHRLKQMRDAGNTWSEIAKVGPSPHGEICQSLLSKGVSE